jgi:HAE1 family hydrophobic/amphiphilic exporter-1
MFRFFAHLAVARPVLTSMLVAVFVFLGAFSYLAIPLDLFPTVDFPIVTVTTIYPGAGPEEVETEITEPIEDAISTIANLESLSSFSQENVSTIIVEFDFDVDADLAAIEVKDKVDAIRARLPSDAEPPTILKLDINAMPIMDVTISGPQALEALTDFADDVLRERLARVEGVASVSLAGGLEREVQVLVHPDRLRAYGLSITEVAALVGGENITIPAGRVTEPDAEFSVRVVGEYTSVADIQDLPLSLPQGGRIRLAEVATVREGFADVREIARYNGQPTLSLSIQKQSGANTVAAAAGVFEAIEELREQLPAGAEMEIARDASEFIRDAVRDIFKNILIGIALTTAVLFLFLHSWRGTVVAAIAMPATIIASFLAIDQAGFTINIMTLMALGITVGILVTNTIVVLESIYRHLDEGKSPGDATEIGTTEVAVAVAASALTNVVVFTPIAFMQGIIGQFFVSFGLTVVFATLVSVLISFTLTPMLAAKLLRTYETKLEETEGLLSGFWRAFDRGYESLQADYRSALGWVLAKPSHGWAVIGGTGVLFVLALVVQVAFVGGEFMPEQDEGLALITLEFPPGTPPERSSQTAARAEALLAEIPEITTTLTQIGGQSRSFGGGSVSEVNIAQIQVTVESELPTTELIPLFREKMAAIPDADVTVTLTQSAGPGGEAPLMVLIKGPERGRLEALAQEATAVMASIPGLVDVRNSIENPRREMVFRPNRDVLADHGLSVFSVGGTLRASIEGVVPGVYREAGDERDIRVRLTEESRNRTAELGSMQVRSRRGMVPVSSLGDVEENAGETTIQRDEKQRTVQIDAYIGGGNLAALASEIQLGLDEIGFPPGYSYEITGEFEMFQESLTEMLKALVMAIVLTYIVLAMILESYVHPFTIMLTLPLGFVGAVFSLFLAGASLNIFSMMAIIMLVGIVVNNAILILDFTHQLREQGMGIVEALMEAAPIRLRPIVMTNIAIAIALLPQATGSGAGSFYRIPMAVVTIGGVLVAALFTLFLIPVIYTKLDRFAAASVRSRRQARKEEKERATGQAEVVPQEG